MKFLMTKETTYQNQSIVEISKTRWLFLVKNNCKIINDSQVEIKYIAQITSWKMTLSQSSFISTIKKLI